ncbi:MAG TPA: hypothetical protein PK280_10890 [Planctomycetota bacterium]|nr:hypothetical protein [Planctomycetota bacterium]
MTDAERTPLPTGLSDPARAPDLVAVREWLAAERERAVDAARAEPRSGLKAAAGYSAALDDLLGALARRLPGAGGGLALAALGDWAWRLATPHGPVEGAFLAAATAAGGTGAAGSDEAAAAVEELAMFLGDAGLDCRLTLRAAGERVWPVDGDASECAAAVVARLAWGDAALFGRFRAELSAALPQRLRAWTEAVVAAALGRHSREGGSACRSQPDLAENPGGLGDYLAVEWLEAARRLAGEPGRGLLAEEDLEEAREAAGLLAGCRIVAHGLAGSRADRLDYELQGRLAAALGYRPGEDLGAAALLMRDVFTALRAVARALRAAAPEYEEESSWGGRRKAAMDRRRSVAGDFTRIGSRLYLARPDLFEGRDGGLHMLQGFAAAARARLALSQEFLKRVRDNLYAAGDDLRGSAEAAGLFREILRSRAGAAPVLRAMHESGLLGAYLPEFAGIDCLTTTDVYHEYTVDEHSLMAAAALDAAERAAPGTPELAAALCSQIPAMDVVKLAALLHDVGKAKAGSGHEERAGVMLPRIAKQLRLAEDEARLLIFLVENHQLLANAAGSRLTTEDKLLSDLAEGIGEGARLDALYLVTWADLSAVGGTPLAAWRSEQLAALHGRLSARLSARPARGRGRLAEELRAALPDRTAALEEHLSKVPERYLLEVSPEEAALHIRLLEEMAAERERSGGAAEPVAVDFHRRASHVHFWVLGPDRPRRFSQIAGAFLAAGASIFGARAYTRSDGVIIDQFDVVDAAAPDSGGTDEFWRAAAATVREVLSGRADLAGLVAAARRHTSGAAPVRRDVPARVTFDNAVSADYTVIDVSCADRVGLLYDLCAALSDSGADIAFAKIATEGGVATDCFYAKLGDGKITGREDMGRIRSALLKACRER